ncbi:MAG: hypothetical protein GX446_12565 [Chthonomonadales bacterium]|nr:hypothetical protein [Chthonomonadales bacterium]
MRSSRARSLMAALGCLAMISSAACRKQGEIITPDSQAPAGATSGGIHRVDAAAGQAAKPVRSHSDLGVQRMRMD